MEGTLICKIDRALGHRLAYKALAYTRDYKLRNPLWSMRSLLPRFGLDSTPLHPHNWHTCVVYMLPPKHPPMPMTLMHRTGKARTGT